MAGEEEYKLGRSDIVSPDTLVSRPEIILKETTFDGTTFVCPTWDQMGQYNFELADQILASGQTFDRVVALSRGGLTWARSFADALRIPKISSMRIKTYDGIGQVGKPEIIQPLTDAVAREKVIIVDEVVESGVTIELAKPYVEIMGAIETKTAALCCKPHTKTWPDYYAFKTSAWVIFPHEIREAVDDLAAAWIRTTGDRDALSKDEIEQRFIEIGMPPKEFMRYLDLFWKENMSY